MRVTIDHPQSCYGQPVILADDGRVMNFAPGIRAVRYKLGLSAEQLATLCGVSRRTVEGWEQGRVPTTAALNVMGKLLEQMPAPT